MQILITTLFILAYLLISLEHYTKINKAAVALLASAVSWMAIGASGVTGVSQLMEGHLTSVAEIVVFLMCAMAIVEIMDSNRAFEVVTNRIRTRSRTSFLVVIGLMTFFMSAVLDNLSTAIVMIAIVLKFGLRDDEKALVVGLIVIAANSGGAFSPIGDVTTTMLWIGGLVTPIPLVASTFLPSFASFAIPAVFIIILVARRRKSPLGGAIDESIPMAGVPVPRFAGFVLFFGVALLLFVPVLRLLTGLPPYLGMIFALGCTWTITEIYHVRSGRTDKAAHSVADALRRIDLPSLLFFVGILLSVAALDASGILLLLGEKLDTLFHERSIIAAILGLFSSIFDNVPLVAAAMHMYPPAVVPLDDPFWHLLAYTAGTGGSILIIGSAAGVVAMGQTRITFGEYARRVAPIALAGYCSGILVFLVQGMSGC